MLISQRPYKRDCGNNSRIIRWIVHVSITVNLFVLLRLVQFVVCAYGIQIYPYPNAGSIVPRKTPDLTRPDCCLRR